MTKKGLGTNFNGVVTIELEETDFEYELFTDTPNQMSDQIPKSSIYKKITGPQLPLTDR